jgi:hypothetical protein
MPREHGAYAQLGFPLVTGLIYSGGAPGAVAFAVAAIAFFLAHEPLAIIAGTRGKRLQEQHRGAARRRILFLGAAAAAGLVAAIGLAPARAWMGAVLPAGIALLLLPLLGTRQIKSVPAEILVAVVFSGSVLPLALSGPAGWGEAALAAAVWLAAAIPAILAVHAIKANQTGRPEGRWTLAAAPVAAALAALAGVAVGLFGDAWIVGDGSTLRDALAVLPPAIATLVVGIVLPHARHLRRVGWTMVAADALALALLLIL